jgi:hypothetical protein
MALIGSPNRPAHAAHQSLPTRQHRLSPRTQRHRLQHLAFVIDGAPKVVELAVDLHKHLIQMPASLRIGAHVRDASLTDLGGEHRPNWFHQNRTVSWLMSIPRSAKRSSTFRSDSGYLTYIITTRRMTSGELLKYRNGLLMV